MLNIFLNDLMASLPSKPEKVIIVNDNAKIINSQNTVSSSRVEFGQEREGRRDRWCRMSRSSSDSCVSIPQRKKTSGSSRTSLANESFHLPSSSSSVPAPPLPESSMVPVPHRRSRSEPGHVAIQQQRKAALRWSPECASRKRADFLGVSSAVMTDINAILNLTAGRQRRGYDSVIHKPTRQLSPHITNSQNQSKKCLSELDDSTHLQRMNLLKLSLRGATTLSVHATPSSD